MASNNSSAPSAPLIYPFERHLQSAGYICFGLTAIVGNVFIASVIIRAKLRSNFFVGLLFVLAARIMIGVNIFSTATYRLTATFGTAVPLNRFSCAVLWSFIIPSSCEGLLLLVMAVDRCIALFAVISYRKLTVRRSVQIYTIATASMFVLKIGMIFGDPPLFTQRTACLSRADVLPAVNLAVTTNIDLALLIVLILLNVVMIVALRYRARELRKNTGHTQAFVQSVERQMKTMVTLRNIVIVHIVWTLVGRLILSISGMEIPPAVQARLTLYGPLYNSTELVVNVFTVIMSNADIKRETMKIFRSTQVQPVVSLAKPY